jgi:hypothetical protein
MKAYDSILEIDAPAEQVWAVLTDFSAYPEWNPALPTIGGDLSVGSTLSMELDLGGRRMAVTAEVQELEPGRRFSWKGNLGADLLFTGRREFTVSSAGPDTTTFRHVESLRGLIVPVFLLAKGKAVAGHHHGLNAAVKKRAEELASRPG